MTRCWHRDSMYGRCASCGLSWENQALAAAARPALSEILGQAHTDVLDDREVLTESVAAGVIT